jgi:exodeoxyribonuclease III
MTLSKCCSWNLNGIRSAHQKGFADWLKTCDADVVLVQEVRAHAEVIPSELMSPFGYTSAWFAAEKKGYSGVGIYHKFPAEAARTVSGVGLSEYDSEGRVLTLVHKDLAYISAYFPNSQAEGKRLDFKLGFCAALERHLKKLRSEGLHVILGGDFNIAHEPIDLANPKQNEKNPGYLPQEREWLTELFKKGYFDTFRKFEKGAGHYSWWSQRSGARAKNIGWRIDSHIVNAELNDRVVAAKIHPQVLGSDHCPVEVSIAV